MKSPDTGKLRCATFNVLADAYLGYGDYSHVDPALLVPGARLDALVRQVNGPLLGGVDIIGLQEADRSLVEAFEDDERWQTLWSPKRRNKPDGCLTLVKNNVEIADYNSFSYSDESGHVFQIVQIGHVAIANTHLKWASADDPRHIGVSQARELLDILTNQPIAVILADCNDRPGGPVRSLVEGAGFKNVSADKPTAVVNKELVALDLLAVRGLSAHWVDTNYDLNSIPNEACPSDHIPLVADLEQ